MVFNWFRRQNKKSSDASSEQKQEQEIEQVSTPSTEESSTPESPPAQTEDLLAFAKAAYKNIQDKQQTTEVSTEVEETSEEITESPQEATEVVSQSEEVVEESTEPQPEETTDTVSEVETSDAIVTGEDVISEVKTEVETEEISEPAAPLSFLERARAEREARQERLVASAIEVPDTSKVEQPAAVLSDTSEPVQETTELPFDEGFLWSTEVLAAQGRRAEDVSIEEINWLKKLRQGLDKTRRSVVNQLKAIVGKGPLNADAVDEIEALLLQADVGIKATDYIINALQEKLRQEALPPEEGIAYLKKILRDILDKPLLESPESAVFTPDKDSFNIWLMTGVNGAGKTTTIGKIAHLANKSGYKCLIGAADTFRAAAVQQVKVWGERSGVEVIANPGKNTDPAAVVFDAIAAAQSRNTELLLVDTAGRLQNKKNLMDELSKIRRIIKKKAPDAKVESLLVLDATLGQNGLRQAEVFSQAAELSGVVLTKLDGTAKGGVALAVVQQLGLPIRFIGAGEGMEDLRPFSSYEFVEALLSG
ncbi:signal recognition particle-docking protein FtsY [Calothrix sp. CCY 0018]|uniref:signal recognition particle-docking protein FtsY n=1 Tax=Calothrix sp. CCY 0018 TaxID=3103864 RepID=UPI0039C715B9